MFLHFELLSEIIVICVSLGIVEVMLNLKKLLHVFLRFGDYLRHYTDMVQSEGSVWSFQNS